MRNALHVPNTNQRLPLERLRLIHSRRHLRYEQKINNNYSIRKQVNELNKAIKFQLRMSNKTSRSKQIEYMKQRPRNNDFWKTFKSLALYPY